MIADEQVDAVRQEILGPVDEAEGRPGADDAQVKEMGEEGVEGDLSKADDDPDAREGGELMREVIAAVADLFGERFVAGRGTADDGSDPDVAELEAVAARGGGGLAGKAKLMEDRDHEVPGAIAGERTTGAVGAVGSGSESKEKNAGARVAEAGNGARPVDLVDVGTAPRLADGGAEGAKTRTALTEGDLLLDLQELSLSGGGRHVCDDTVEAQRGRHARGGCCNVEFLPEP